MILPNLLIALLGGLLLAIAWIDYRRMVIPWQLPAAIALLALPYLYSSGLDFRPALTGGALAGSIGYGLRRYFQWRLGQPALGRGDIRLLAALGLWVGIDGLSLFLLVAGCAGLGTALVWRLRRQGRYFPFGPALGVGGLFSLLSQLQG